MDILSRGDWGEFMASFPTRGEAEQFILENEVRLSAMGYDTTAETFHIRPTYDNVRGRNWFHAVYFRPWTVTEKDGR